MYRFRTRSNVIAIMGWLLAVAQAPAEMSEGWCAMEVMQGGVSCTRGPCDDPVNRDLRIPDGSSPLLTMRLKFNVFCDDAGLNCAASQEEIDAQVEQLNVAFRENYRIEFVREPTAFIPNARFKDFCSESGVTCRCPGPPEQPDCQVLCGEEQAMKNQYADNPTQQLNIYVTDTSSAGFTGLGYFPWCPEATDNGGGIIVDGASVGGVACGPLDEDPCRVLTHEIGHILGLWHTFHGVSEIPGGCTAACWESALCDGSCQDPLCDAVGDLCCDTPTTPSNRRCRDPLGGGDACVGLPWAPTDFTNYMASGGDGCWDHFTNQQAGRLHCWTCDTVQGWIAGQDCNNNGAPDACDISGATSSDCNANGVPDECDCATPSILDVCGVDCNTNGVHDLCDILGGASQDCNTNNIPDSCDISSGFSQDCPGGPGNGIPDECEPDCQPNQVADSCDIDTGMSQDCNSNGVPDECDNGCCYPSDCGSLEVCCSNECVECCDDSDCPIWAPLCRTSDHNCVFCLTNQDCPFGCCKPDGVCRSCGPCQGPGCANE